MNLSKNLDNMSKMLIGLPLLYRFNFSFSCTGGDIRKLKNAKIVY